MLDLRAENRHSRELPEKMKRLRNRFIKPFPSLSVYVGMTGFEPATTSSLTKCATKLRYIPIDYWHPQQESNLQLTLRRGL